MTLVGVVGAGVVGGRVLRMLNGNVELAVHERRADLAEARAREVGAAVIDEPRDLRGCDVVVVSRPSPQTALIAELVAHGVAVVSVTGDGDDVQAMLALDEHARHVGVPLVAAAAMSPGLSGLIARWLADSFATIDEVHVAMHGTAGPSCAREHHRALGSRAVGWQDGRWISPPGGSGRELCWFPEPVGAYDCYRAQVTDPMLLHELFPTASRISARVSANRRDRFTARLPMLRSPHPEGGVGALRVEVRGAGSGGERLTAIGGIAEFVGTASAATAAAFAERAAAGTLDAGLVLPGAAALPTADILERIGGFGVRLQAFTGTPRPG